MEPKTKITATQKATIREILARGGVVKSSEWTSGKGRFASCRTIPPYCAKFGRDATIVLPEHVRQYFLNTPLVRYVIAARDILAAEQATRED